MRETLRVRKGFNHHLIKAKAKGICQLVGSLHNTKPIYLWTAKYATRTLSGVRGALRQSLAEPPTRLPVGLLSVNCCKPLSLFSFTVIVFVVSGCAVGIFYFQKGRRFFLIQFFLRGKGGSSFASFALCLGLCGLQMCLHLCDVYLSMIFSISLSYL